MIILYKYTLIALLVKRLTEIRSAVRKSRVITERNVKFKEEQVIMVGFMTST